MKLLISIFGHFLYLGCISFGGPAAHLGYFQRYFIAKHQWMDNQRYAQTVALSQFLPGPGSSQVGFALGYHKAGLAGAMMAFIGFTLPSFLLLYLLALLGQNFADSPTVIGAIYGLKLLAVVVVFDAVLAMAKSFCQHLTTKVIAVITLVFMVFLGGLFTQLSLLFVAGIVGVFLLKNNALAEGDSTKNVKTASQPHKLPIHFIPLMLFTALFLLTFSNIDTPLLRMFNDFFQAGSLVFGGGHVVLPLLQESISHSQINTETFLLGYASAQAIPGPMFTMATFLGANMYNASPFVGALVATSAIFLPGFLLLLGLQKAWHVLANNARALGFVSGVNAAVVGLLAAALYQPVMMNSIHHWHDVALVIVGLVLLRFYRLPILALVAFFLTAGVTLTLV